MNSLTKYTDLLRRFPSFELSYETVSHKKVSSSDSLAIAISLGKKYFIWHTYKQGCSDNVCYLIGLDKDKQISSVEEKSFVSPFDFHIGTIVYGTMYEHSYTDTKVKPIFIADDIYYYCGTNVSKLCFGDRIGFLQNYVKNSGESSVVLPIMWCVNSGKEHSYIIPEEVADKMGYVPHHIQYREIHRVAPYINIPIPKKGMSHLSASVPMSSASIAQKITATAILKPIPQFDFAKPAYRQKAIFNITADPQPDLYHLYAYGGVNAAVYCGLAGIQSYKTSIFMNTVFRKIRENENLDLAEESEDEADFENTDANKYVNLDLVVPVECTFNQKHKKWIPMRLAKKNEHIIHIEKLIYVGRTLPTKHR